MTREAIKFFENLISETERVLADRPEMLREVETVLPYYRSAIEALSQIEELQRKIDIDHAEYTNLWAENQRLKQEKPKGRWKLLDECANAGVYCSVCYKKVYRNDYANVKAKSNFCPNCGASMRGSEQE